MWQGQQVAAVVAAGGIGRRAGGETPKQFVAVAGTPVLVRTLRVFEASPVVDRVIVVAGAGHLETARALVAGHRLGKVAEVAEGGAERQDSVWYGLERLHGRGFGLVLVHDAVRPFFTEALIESVCASAAAGCGAAVPVLRPADTVVTLDTGGMITAGHDRNLLGIVQTPQAFRFEILYEAFRLARKDGFLGTDDASLVLHAGGAVKGVPGNALNFKITTADDLAFAEIVAAAL